jgi:arsenate reductase-like glutaredoxin family protein
MNIQIFGKKKCFDTKKAERYFKERRIKFQFVDIMDKGLSPGELRNVSQAVGGLQNLVDSEGRDYYKIKHFGREQWPDKLEEMPELYKTPIVRNGRQATVGYKPDVWKTWE